MKKIVFQKYTTVSFIEIPVWFFFDRKRRKQTHVPVESKDDKYWARRIKNNEAAKRSRDMRIKREKVVFEENSRLEQDNREMRTELVWGHSNNTWHFFGSFPTPPPSDIFKA